MTTTTTPTATIRYAILIDMTPDDHYGIPGYGKGLDSIPKVTALTWLGDIEAGADDEDALNAIWDRHNRDDRPDGQIGPSLSTGDAVRLDGPNGPRFYAVASVGWTPIEGVRIDPRSYLQITAEAREATGGFRHPAPGYPLPGA